MNLFQQAKYLKHIGKLNDTKITFSNLNGRMVIYIQDREFFDFQAALRFLQEDARNIVEEAQAA